MTIYTPPNKGYAQNVTSSAQNLAQNVPFLEKEMKQEVVSLRSEMKSMKEEIMEVMKTQIKESIALISSPPAPQPTSMNIDMITLMNMLSNFRK